MFALYDQDHDERWPSWLAAPLALAGHGLFAWWLTVGVTPPLPIMEEKIMTVALLTAPTPLPVITPVTELPPPEPVAMLEPEPPEPEIVEVETPKPEPSKPIVKPKPKKAAVAPPVEAPPVEREPTPPPPPPVEVAEVAPIPEESVIAPAFNADYLNNPAPNYPRQARRLGEQGTVLLRVLVNVEGEAASVQLAKSCGSARLDQAAQEAVQQWRFVPARQGNLKKEAQVIVPIVFELEG
jgi:protein TonB